MISAFHIAYLNSAQALSGLEAMLLGHGNLVSLELCIMYLLIHKQIWRTLETCNANFLQVFDHTWPKPLAKLPKTCCTTLLQSK